MTRGATNGEHSGPTEGEGHRKRRKNAGAVSVYELLADPFGFGTARIFRVCTRDFVIAVSFFKRISLRVSSDLNKRIFFF